MKIKYKYEDLSNGMKNSLMKNLIIRYTYEGKENPEEEALIKLTKIEKDKTKKSWRRMIPIYMKLIDKKREEMGLEKIHNIVGI